MSANSLLYTPSSRTVTHRLPLSLLCVFCTLQSRPVSAFSLTPGHLILVLPLASQLTAALLSKDSLLPNVSALFSTLFLVADGNDERRLLRSCPPLLAENAGALA